MAAAAAAAVVRDCVHQIFINADTTKESGEREGERGRRWGEQPTAPANASALSPALYLPPLVSLSAIYEMLPFPPSVCLADRPSSPPKRKVMHILDAALIGVAADVENIGAVMKEQQLVVRERFLFFLLQRQKMRDSVIHPPPLPPPPPVQPHLITAMAIFLYRSRLKAFVHKPLN